MIVVKAFVSVDMEGMPYVVIPGHLNLKGVLYEEARKTATRITLTVAEELHKNEAKASEEPGDRSAHALSLRLLGEHLLFELRDGRYIPFGRRGDGRLR